MAKKWTEYSDNEIYGFSIIICTALGVALGSALGNVGAGIAIGAGLSVAFAEWGKMARNQRRARDLEDSAADEDPKDQ